MLRTFQMPLVVLQLCNRPVEMFKCTYYQVYARILNTILNLVYSLLMSIRYDTRTVLHRLHNILCFNSMLCLFYKDSKHARDYWLVSLDII